MTTSIDLTADMDTKVQYCVAVSGIGYLHDSFNGDQVLPAINTKPDHWLTPTLIMFTDLDAAERKAKDLAAEYKRLGVHTDRHVVVQERIATTRYTEWRTSEDAA